MFPSKTPKLLRKVLHHCVWEKPNTENKIYLTFDDGPIPELTPWVLDVLKKKNVLATFFCVGNNVNKYPEIFKRIINEGHSIGNHTFHHLNSWKTSHKDYLLSIQKTHEIFLKYDVHSHLFRPPYGKLSFSHTKSIIEMGYDIIMWSVLSKDYNQNISSEQVYYNVVNHTESGSIIVCHDNLKSLSTVKSVLPKMIDYLNLEGFLFDKL